MLKREGATKLLWPELKERIQGVGRIAPCNQKWEPEMSELMQANRQWARRPADERFISLLDMKQAAEKVRYQSEEITVATNHLRLAAADNNALVLNYDKKGETLGELSNWAFQQATVLADTAASSMRSGRPAGMVADWVNWALINAPKEDKVKVYKRLPIARAMPADVIDLDPATGEVVAPIATPYEVAALTGPSYGRVYDMEVIDELINRFGDGTSGVWRVPGEFGRNVPITKGNTTLYYSDRSMFVFLANEHNRIEVKNRRNGKPGSMARGFFIWNSETGAETLGFKSFYFDYVCSNRIVWGAEGVKTIKIRHSKTAPQRFMDDVQPQLILFAAASARKEETVIAKAQTMLIEHMQTLGVDAWLGREFGPRVGADLQRAHIRAEERPIESLFDVVCAVTEHAKKIPHTDVRLDFEGKAAKYMDLAAKAVGEPSKPVQGATLAPAPVPALPTPKAPAKAVKAPAKRGARQAA